MVGVKSQQSLDGMARPMGAKREIQVMPIVEVNEPPICFKLV
jgi:hypothetical protein